MGYYIYIVQNLGNKIIYNTVNCERFSIIDIYIDQVTVLLINSFKLQSNLWLSSLNMHQLPQYVGKAIQGGLLSSYGDEMKFSRIPFKFLSEILSRE